MYLFQILIFGLSAFAFPDNLRGTKRVIGSHIIDPEEDMIDPQEEAGEDED